MKVRRRSHFAMEGEETTSSVARTTNHIRSHHGKGQKKENRESPEDRWSNRAGGLLDVCAGIAK